MGTHKNFSSLASKLSDKITNLLTKQKIESIAKEIGFIKHDSVKLNGWKILDMLLFTHFNHERLSLNDLALQLHQRYGIVISKQGINNRFNHVAVQFFRAILEEVLGSTLSRDDYMPILDNFTNVRIKDSTAFQLPSNLSFQYPGCGGGASKAGIRIQFEYDYKTGGVIDLSLHPFNRNDMTDARENLANIQENDLIIRDLGFVSQDILYQIHTRQAYFLNRLPVNNKVYTWKNDSYQLLDFSEIEAYLKKYNLSYLEKQVYIGKKTKTMIPIRILIEILPEEEKNKRLRSAKKMAKKKGRSLSKEYKARMGLNIFITNIPESIYPTKEISQLYRLRWQIEIIFKTWKSFGKINKVKMMNVYRFECYLIAKLIWLMLNWQIFWHLSFYYYNAYGILMSPIKLCKTVTARMDDFRNALHAGYSGIYLFLLHLKEIVPRNIVIEKKKDKLSQREIIFRLSYE
jgi:hypothetical protein